MGEVEPKSRLFGFSALMRGKRVQPRQYIRVLAHEKDERGRLRIRFRAALFPLFQRPFVNPQFAREYRSRAAQLFPSVAKKL
jgi:hypothetical protein